MNDRDIQGGPSSVLMMEMDGPDGLVNALFSDPEVSLNFWVVGLIVPRYKAFSFGSNIFEISHIPKTSS